MINLCTIKVRRCLSSVIPALLPVIGSKILAFFFFSAMCFLRYYPSETMFRTLPNCFSLESSLDIYPSVDA